MQNTSMQNTSMHNTSMHNTSMESQLEILKKGYLIYKKNHKVFVMLCSPVSIADVATVYHTLFPGKEGIQNRASILGNIAYAAMEETPVMILLQSERNVSRPNFVHFIDVISVEDEVDIGVACSIRINTKDHVLYFSATTSTEYQIWISAFQEAYRQAHSNEEYHNDMEEAAADAYHNDSQEAVVTCMSPMSPRGIAPTLPQNTTVLSSSSSSNNGNSYRVSLFSDMSTSPKQNPQVIRGSRKNSEPLFSRLFSACKSPDPDMQYKRKMNRETIN